MYQQQHPLHMYILLFFKTDEQFLTAENIDRIISNVLLLPISETSS